MSNSAPGTGTRAERATVVGQSVGPFLMSHPVIAITLLTALMAAVLIGIGWVAGV